MKTIIVIVVLTLLYTVYGSSLVDGYTCGFTNCTASMKCCGSSTNGRCIYKNYQCCDSLGSSCSTGFTCCNSKYNWIRATCCGIGAKCYQTSSGNPYCCPSNQSPCNGH
jgi:hypothetical protein